MAPPRKSWASLPDNILELIAAALSDDEYIRFRTVCRSWHALIPSCRISPHLMIRRSRSDPINFHKLVDHSISFSCTPDPADATLCGSSTGWIAFQQHNGDVFLFNPVTGARIELPSVHSIDKATLNRIPITNKLIGNVFLSKSPLFCPDYIVLATLPESISVAIWKPGDLVWTIVEIGMSDIKTAVYCKDRFFLTDLMSVAALDVGPLVRVSVLRTPETFDSYRIFRLMNWHGELLLLYRSLLCQHPFLLFKYTQNSLNDWTEVTSLGNSSMFISVDHPYCFISSLLQDCLRNCIYISGSSGRMAAILGMTHLLVETKKHLFSMLTLEDNEIKHVFCDWLSDYPDIDTWFCNLIA